MHVLFIRQTQLAKRGIRLVKIDEEELEDMERPRKAMRFSTEPDAVERLELVQHHCFYPLTLLLLL